jgi:aminoglycoside phosphotransferase (APT) family kinase protein
LWEATRTREVPAVERIASWLAHHRPASGPAAIVHGDYRLGNLLASDGEIAGVLDWEMATLGDPLADLGYLCAFWADPDDPIWACSS